MKKVEIYWFRGNKEHGLELIEKLEELGHTNIYGYDGRDFEYVYFVYSDYDFIMRGRSNELKEGLERECIEIYFSDATNSVVVGNAASGTTANDDRRYVRLDNIEASELMLGDLVAKNNRITKVVGIFKNPRSSIPECCLIDMKGNRLKVADIEPIPLTGDVLIANGFTRKEDIVGWSNYFYMVEDIPKACIWDHKDEALRVLILGKYWDLKYVHELQHLLRFMNLNELADNFKLSNYGQSQETRVDKYRKGQRRR